MNLLLLENLISYYLKTVHKSIKITAARSYKNKLLFKYIDLIRKGFLIGIQALNGSNIGRTNIYKLEIHLHMTSEEIEQVIELGLYLSQINNTI